MADSRILLDLLGPAATKYKYLPPALLIEDLSLAHHTNGLKSLELTSSVIYQYIYFHDAAPL
jgi:hypothetical protein